MQQSQYEPCSTIRFSCPVILELWINPLLVQFMQQYPKIHFDVWGINRYVDIIEENCDFAIRARSYPLPDQSMIMRKFCSAKLMLVSSPNLLVSRFLISLFCKIILAVATATAQNV